MNTNTKTKKKEIVNSIEYADKIVVSKNGMRYHVPSVGWITKRWKGK